MTRRGPVLGLTMGKDRTTEIHYRCALERAGAVARVIATRGAQADAVDLSQLSGMVFSGGGDIHPSRYRATPESLSREIDTERDAFEIPLVHRCLEARLPVLGICRGIQVLNVALGGTLYQDILTELPGQGLRHKLKTTDANRFHRVSLAPGSWLQRMHQELADTVNSHHHQSVRAPGNGLRVTAWAPDGVVEAVEGDPELGLVLGFQWHPERLSWGGQWPIRGFVEACVAVMGTRRGSGQGDGEPR